MNWYILLETGRVGHAWWLTLIDKVINDAATNNDNDCDVNDDYDNEEKEVESKDDNDKEINYENWSKSVLWRIGEISSI